MEYTIYEGRLIPVNELMHHGVLGQKWGKRNGPPYPLQGPGKAKLSKQRSDSSSKNVASESQIDNVKLGKTYNKYTNAGKAVIDTVLRMVPGYSIASLATKKLVATGKQAIQDRKREKNTNIDTKTGLKLQNKQLKQEQDLSRVNPGYQPFKKGTSNNCPMCCVAYDLRRRGFDVRAEQSKNGMSMGDIEKLYKNTKFKSALSENVYKKASTNSAVQAYKKDLGIGYYNKSPKEIADDITHSITSQGDSRGILRNAWRNIGATSGHVVSYEVKNGKLTIMDGQSNTVYKNPRDYLTKTDLGSVMYMRTDNAEPNYKAIKEKGIVKS